MKLCVVGSRALVMDGNVAVRVVELLASLEHGSEILLRKPLTRPMRPFEALVASLATTLGHTPRAFVPEPGGRSKVYLRDVEMVGAADEVVAFFQDGDEMTGGTAHVVEKAIDQRRPVRAYALSGDQMRLIAEEDWAMEGGWM